MCCVSNYHIDFWVWFYDNRTKTNLQTTVSNSCNIEIRFKKTLGHIVLVAREMINWQVMYVWRCYKYVRQIGRDNQLNKIIYFA